KSTGFPQPLHIVYWYPDGTRPVGKNLFSTPAVGPVGDVPEGVPPRALALAAGEGRRHRSEESGTTRKEACCDIRGFHVTGAYGFFSRRARKAVTFGANRIVELTAPTAAPSLPYVPSDAHVALQSALGRKD